MLAISGLMCGLPSCDTHSVLQACRAYRVEVNVGGGEEERKQVMGSAGINWELRKRNLFSMHEADITVSCFKNTLFFLIFFLLHTSEQNRGRVV